MTAQRFFLSIENLTKSRGEIGELSFTGGSPEGFAQALQTALREPTLWQRWKALQPDPDSIDTTLGVSDPKADVVARQADLHTDFEVTTTLPHAVLKHRLALLIGNNWKLHDVRFA